MPEGEESSRGPTAEQVVAALSHLQPADLIKIRRALGTTAPPGTGGEVKFSTALQAVGDSEVDDVLEAIDDGLSIPPHEDQLAPLRSVSPELANAAAANSGRRRKDLAHSLRVAKQWLEEHHERAEVADDEPAEPGAPSTAGHRKRKRKGHQR